MTEPHSEPAAPESESDASSRRQFLGAACTAAMGCGLVASYGTAAAFAARYLYPAKPQELAWVFVAPAARLASGGSMIYKTPAGATINVARQGDSGAVEDFIALSSVCPHLGCQVYWESQNNRFFCPCHNGAFDAQGVGVSGPPAGQALLRYPLKIEGELLFIQVPVAEA